MSSIFRSITDQVLAALKRGLVPWRKTWSHHGPAQRNLGGKLYRGENQVRLCLARDAGAFRSVYWGTEEEIHDRGWLVKRGERSTTLVFRQEIEPDDSNGPRRELVLPPRYFGVFNVEQCVGPIPPKFLGPPAAGNREEALKAAEDIVQGYRGAPPILHDGGDRAFYIPREDEIHLPPRHQFESVEDYYVTLFHEMGHSTGHQKRLNRRLQRIPHKDIHARGKEELVAEMTAAFLAAEAGIDEVVVRENASYIQSWLLTIREDPTLVEWASVLAQKATECILGDDFRAGDPARAALQRIDAARSAGRRAAKKAAA